jgi:hypothetical protein
MRFLNQNKWSAMHLMCWLFAGGGLVDPVKRPCHPAAEARDKDGPGKIGKAKIRRLHWHIENWPVSAARTCLAVCSFRPSPRQIEAQTKRDSALGTEKTRYGLASKPCKRPKDKFNDSVGL